MISTITEGEFGQGEWFKVLIGACIYVVMRKEDRPLPMAEVASTIGIDVYEISRMILRVVDFLNLRPDFPEFDIVHLLERMIRNCSGCASAERNLIERMRKQGMFLIQCAVKWYLSIEWRPVPLVVAVLVFMVELNGVGVGMEELAKEVHARVSTCRARYKELLETLVKVAQVLPWGKDVTVKNIIKNALVGIQYMERNAMLKHGEKREEGLDQATVDLKDVVVECLRNDGEFEYGVDGMSKRKDSRYFMLESNAGRVGGGDSERQQISLECLSVLYKKFLDENHCAESLRGSGSAQKRRILQFDLLECWEL
ncbi:hypothetical protein JHK87_010192 [Glycine soja]|nr:hypothetical protein JHK87_010192 [Glycine soja]